MAIQVVEFSSEGYKIRKIFPKNQLTQSQLLNFEFWINGNKNKQNTLYHLRCTFWRKTKKHDACPATAKLDILSNKLYKKIPHNHGSDDRNCMIANLTRETLNKIEENPTDNSRKIFNEVAKKYPGVKHKTSFTKIESAAFYRSKKNLPLPDDSLMTVMLP